jgi:MarR family transcriptional regulator, organic hydroperoxide resistance regulator
MKTDSKKEGDGEELPPLGDVLEFMRVLWAVDHGLQSTSKRMETSMGVTGPQRLVIRIVGRFPGIAAGQLARVLHVHPSTLTGILKRLEQRGIVSRQADPADARRALLHLTARGRELDQTKSGTVESGVRRALARVPPDKVKTAREVLVLLGEELTKPT